MQAPGRRDARRPVSSQPQITSEHCGQETACSCRELNYCPSTALSVIHSPQQLRFGCHFMILCIYSNPFVILPLCTSIHTHTCIHYLTDGVPCYPQTLQTNFVTYLKLRHGRFLPHPFQFFTQQISCHLTLRAIRYSVVELQKCAAHCHVVSRPSLLSDRLVATVMSTLELTEIRHVTFVCSQCFSENQLKSQPKSLHSVLS